MTTNPNLRTIARAIADNPGITVSGITKLTGIPNRRIQGFLTTLESSGFLIAEDHQGRLFPFDPRKACPELAEGPPNLIAALLSDRKDTVDD